MSAILLKPGCGGGMQPKPKPKPFVGMLIWSPSTMRDGWYKLKELSSGEGRHDLHSIKNNRLWLVNTEFMLTEPGWVLYPGEPDCPDIPEDLQHEWKEGDEYYWYNSRWKHWGGRKDQSDPYVFTYSPSENGTYVSDFAKRALYIPSADSLTIYKMEDFTAEELKRLNTRADASLCAKCSEVLKQPWPDIKYCPKCEG